MRTYLSKPGQFHDRDDCGWAYDEWARIRYVLTRREQDLLAVFHRLASRHPKIEGQPCCFDGQKKIAGLMKVSTRAIKYLLASLLHKGAPIRVYPLSRPKKDGKMAKSTNLVVLLSTVNFKHAGTFDLSINQIDSYLKGRTKAWLRATMLRRNAGSPGEKPSLGGAKTFPRVGSKPSLGVGRKPSPLTNYLTLEELLLEELPLKAHALRAAL